MKFLMTLTVLLSLNAFAQEPVADGADKGNFADNKAKAIEHIEKKIAMMNEMKSCVSSATDQAALKACREKMHEQHKGMRMEHMDRKIQRLQDKKAKMGSK